MFVKILALAAAATLSACATAPSAPPAGDLNDPYEGFNRQMFAFNAGVDKYALGPAATAYETVTPAFARDRVGDFLANLGAPVILTNDVLQAEPARAGTTASRFAVNSTLGLLGLWDAAQYLGIDGHREDFGQTLGVWGVRSGPYIVLPIFGPSTPRDLLGTIVDRAIDPLTYVQYDNDDDTDTQVRIGLGIIGALNARVALGPQLEALNSQPEPYTALRRIYSSQRQAAIRNGVIDEATAYDDLPDFDEFDE